jgi:2,4-dienoyl-CoA reductase (NADPH2)
VTIVDQRGAIATDAPIDERALLLERLRRLDVTLITEATIVEAGAGRITVDSPHGRFVIPADTLVLCHGSDADNALAKAVAGRVEQVLCVGDCVAPRRVLDATREGAWAGQVLVGQSTPRAPSAEASAIQPATA